MSARARERSPRVTRPGPIDVVERAYDLDGDWSAWLGGMARAAAPSLDDGFGLIAVAYDARGGGMPRNLGMVATDAAAPHRLALGAIAPDAGIAAMRDVVLHGGLASVSQILGHERFRAMDAFTRHGEPVGMRDFLVLSACDPSGVGVLVGAPTRAVTRATRPRQAAWARVAAHVGAALRLRLALSGRAVDTSSADAVLSTDGALVHASTDAAASARARLREAVTRRARARAGSTAGDLRPWTALVEGRWSLVDVFERDGRRYVVARANEPDVPDPRALAPRERQVVALLALGRSNKVIAYELGLATSRVGTLLTQAARKLGVTSRAELVSMVRGLMSTARPPS
jgi:DNA-binding CsgD family transcriptional regulator